MQSLVLGGEEVPGRRSMRYLHAGSGDNELQLQKGVWEG